MVFSLRLDGQLFKYSLFKQILKNAVLTKPCVTLVVPFFLFSDPLCSYYYIAGSLCNTNTLKSYDILLIEGKISYLHV